MSEPWTRQPGETAQAYRALQFFLELGGGRSIEGCARRLGLRRKDCERWSVQHDWIDRAREHDAWHSIKGEQAESGEEEAEAKKWMRRRAEEAEALYQSARRLRARSAKMLRRPRADATKADGDAPSDIGGGTPRDAALLEEMAAEMARKALELAEPSRPSREPGRSDARRATPPEGATRQGRNNGRLQQVRQVAESSGDPHRPP